MKKYSIIYADPPWFYHFKGSGVWGDAEKHYPTLKTKDLMALSVSKITEDQAVCFMWATFPNLPAALEVMKAWGFTYKTVAFTWIKTTKNGSFRAGMGHFTMANAEIVLVGTKGRNMNRINKSIRQIVQEPITEHSAKPHEVKKRIEALYGDLPRIELFAREKTNGWDTWGNEVPNDIELISPT